MAGKNSRVAVFGANGYLGRHICACLDRQAVAYDAFDIQDSPKPEIRNYRSGDVSDAGFWEGFAAEGYSAIVFLAGLSGPERSFEQAEKYLQVNVLSLLGLLRRCAVLGKDAPRIVFPSSRLVYEGNDRVDENALRRSRSVYAATKVACEELLSAYNARYRVPYVVLRISVPYGNLLSTDYSYGTIGMFVTQCRENGVITVYGDGSNRKTYTYIGDLCRIVFRSTQEAMPSGVYNVGGHDYTLGEVAGLIAAKYGGRIEYVPWPEEAALVEMGSISLDAHKLDALMGLEGYQRLDHYIGSL